jgi:hypothetical protein
VSSGLYTAARPAPMELSSNLPSNMFWATCEFSSAP